MPDSWLPATPWDARAGGQVEELRDVGRRLRGGGALRLELEAVTEVRALSHRVLGGGAELLGPQGDVAEELVGFGTQPQVHGIAGRRDHVVADMLHTVLVGDHDFCCASTSTSASTSASTGATAAPHLGGGPPGVGEHEAVELELLDTAHVFAAGHRIRLTVAGGWFPFYSRNPGTGENPLTAETLHPNRHTVTFGEGTALVLPTLPTPPTEA